MKKIVSIVLIGFSLLCQQAYSCDESCMKEKAQATHNVTFPGYLSWKYCEGIAMDFMTSTMRSIDNYRSKHFNPKYKGPLRNTRNYVAQRKDWLLECDDYISKTKNARVFNDDKTTEEIFASVDRLTSEFDALINGSSYATQDEAKEAMDGKVDTLFQLVEDHKTIMHLKGRYVVR